MKKIYFAHPYSYYGTPIEAEAIAKIKEHFGEDWEIINPGTKEVQYAFKKYQKTNPENYMPFFAKIVEECDAIICMPFITGEISSGVRYEAEAMNRSKGFIYTINHDYHIIKMNLPALLDDCVSIYRTRELLNFHNLQKIKDQIEEELTWENQKYTDPDERSWPAEEGIIISQNQAKLLIGLINEMRLQNPNYYHIKLDFPKIMKNNEDAKHYLSQAVYDATVLFYESIGEHNKMIFGNGHHMAQKMAAQATKLWTEREL